MVRDDTMVYLGIYINVRLQALHPYICNNYLTYSHIFISGTGIFESSITVNTICKIRRHMHCTPSLSYFIKNRRRICSRMEAANVVVVVLL